MDFLVDPSSEQSLRIRGLISSGLVRLVLGEVALPRFTRDCIRRSSLREGIWGDSSGGFTYLLLSQTVLRGRRGRLS